MMPSLELDENPVYSSSCLDILHTIIKLTMRLIAMRVENAYKDGKVNKKLQDFQGN